ncbi:MAG TPA: DNA polymerase [Candidatus Nitrosotalea sp.]|nr:DNA polymerase [Candidatus Nitrosotalea sp.]
MGNKTKLMTNGYKVNNYGFNKKLVNRVHFFTPCEKHELHPVIQSIHVLKDGKLNFFSKTKQEFFDKFPNGIPKDSYINDELFEEIANFYEVQIVVFSINSIYGGKQIQVGKINPKRDRVYGVKMVERIALLKSDYDPKYFAAILPRKDGSIDFLQDKIYCNCHGDWVDCKYQSWKDHLKDCFKCSCGRQYWRGDKHPEECEKEHYAAKAKTKRQLEGHMTRVWKKKEGENPADEVNCYFADFETLVREDRKYTVYAGAWIDDSVQNEEANVYCGKEAMNEFMNAIIQQCNGIMWFFNGSKFDNLFIIPWLLQNKIPIKEGSTIIIGNSILTITFETEKGEVTLKDLCKFLPGTLKANCKAFGLKEDASKKELDHEKMSSWEAIYENEKEIREYVGRDVTCLKKIFTLFRKEMLDQYGLDMVNCVTGPQFAFNCWSTTLKGKGSNLFKTPIEDEKMMREMYKGGRVICGRPIWKSKFFDEIKRNMIDYPNIDKDGYVTIGPGHGITRELYNKIDDYCYYIDANSLYPAAQINRAYPTGKYKKYIIEKGSPTETRIMKHINERVAGRIKENVYRSGFLVDVTCPKDLTIAFLMTKNKKGEVEQNLLPKEMKWFTGPELWEASKLGYKITRVYEVVQFASSKSIFDEFVKSTYKKKQEAERDTPKYTCAKNMLNSLTGKFGQHTIGTITLLFVVGQIIENDIQNITEIYDNLGQVLGWYATSEKTNDFAPFPIHLSAFILAWARIYMSKMLRRMKIERSDQECPLYGDTDSLIIHVNAWRRLDKKWKGDKELGQMKKEVKGKIIRVTVLSPKTYEVTYIDKKTLKICSIVKSKGIPHPHDVCDAFEEYKDTNEEKERAVMEIDFLKNRETSLDFSKTVKIGTKNYVFRDLEGKVIEACTRIPPDRFEKILKREETMECVFGGMVRKFEPGEIDGIYVAPDSKMRTFNKTDWWGRGLRQLSPLDSDIIYPTAYPLGHQKLEIVDYTLVWSIVKPYLLQIYQEEHCEEFDKITYAMKTQREITYEMWRNRNMVDMPSPKKIIEFERNIEEITNRQLSLAQKKNKYHKILITLVCKNDPNQIKK